MRRLLACLALTPFLLAAGVSAPGPARADGFTEAQKAALEQMIRDYIMQHPEVVMESLSNMQARQKADEEEQAKLRVAAHRQALERRPGDPVIGNPDGDVTIVEFFDYQCGYCKSMVPSLVALTKADKGVRVVLKELPILGPVSEIAARASLASMKQGRYEPYHIALMAVRGRLTEQAVYQAAVEVGLDVAKLKQDMGAPEVDAHIQDVRELAGTLDIRGTPGFTIGDKLIPGAFSPEQLLAYVRGARQG